MRKADEGAANGRVIVRGAFAGEIGREGDAGWRLQVVAQLAGKFGRRFAGNAGIPVERIGGRQDHPHLVPGVGKRVAEGVNRALRLRQIGGIGGKEHARGAERHKGMAFGNRAHAAGGCGIVASATGHDDLAGNTPGGRKLGAKHARLIGAFHQRRHMLLIQIGGRQQLGRPLARTGIEPGGASRVRHFRDVLAGQPQAQIILRQKHLGDLGKNLRLVVLHPGELRRGEAGKDDIAGNLAKARVRIELRSFRIGARVVPQDRGAKNVTTRIDQRRAMHLAGKADALDRRKLGGKFRLQPGDRRFGRLDPVGRILLRPAVMRTRNVQRAIGRTDDRLIAIDQQRLDAGCSKIKTEIHVVLQDGM